MLIFAGDSEFPQLIPQHYAELYSADCDFPCPPEVAKRWDRSHKRWFTFKGDPACSMCDFEAHVQIYDDETEFRRWLTERRDGSSTRQSVVYSDLSNAAKAAEWGQDLPFKWLIALWDGPKSPAYIAAQLRVFGVPENRARVEDIAGQQYAVNSEFCSDIWFRYW